MQYNLQAIQQLEKTKTKKKISIPKKITSELSRSVLMCWAPKKTAAYF